MQHLIVRVSLGRCKTGAQDYGFDFLYGGDAVVPCLENHILFNQNAAKLIGNGQ